jgi:hypothetical protein
MMRLSAIEGTEVKTLMATKTIFTNERHPEVFRMSGKELRAAALSKRTGLGKSAAAEIARRKANQITAKASK